MAKEHERGSVINQILHPHSSPPMSSAQAQDVHSLQGEVHYLFTQAYKFSAQPALGLQF